MRKKPILLIITVLILSIVSMSCAKKEVNKNKLTVAMELQFPPFETVDSEGNPAGISVEMAKGLAEFMGKELEIRNTSWTGLIPSLQTGKVDLILSSMSVTEERSKVVDFSEPYAVAGLTLLLNKKTQAESFEDLNNEKFVVAVKSGTIGALLAQDKLKEAKIHLFDDVTNCVLEVSQSKADAFIYDALTVYENYKKHKETTKVNLTTIRGTGKPWAIAVKKGNDELLKAINGYILSSRKNNKFEGISENYLGDLMNFFKKNNIPSFWDVE